MDNHQWLMNSEVLTTLRKLRKRLRAEFGISLKFSDFDFEQQLAQTKLATVDMETRQMIAELELRRGSPFLVGDEVPPRLYRGQPILDDTPKKRDIYELIYGEELALHAPAQHGQLAPGKIYRGQRVLREEGNTARSTHRVYRGRPDAGETG